MADLRSQKPKPDNIDPAPAVHPDLVAIVIRQRDEQALLGLKQQAELGLQLSVATRRIKRLTEENVRVTGELEAARKKITRLEKRTNAKRGGAVGRSSAKRNPSGPQGHPEKGAA